MSAMALNPTETKYPHKDVTIDFLYEACSSVGETGSGKIRFFDCESYVYGVLDSYLAVKPFLPLKYRACFPQKIAPWQVLEEVRPLVLKYDPVTDSAIAGVAIIQALRVKYPCKLESKDQSDSKPTN